MKNKYLYITLLAILGITPEMMAQNKIQYAPRLVVSITVDQLRTDYLEAFSPLYGNDGFKRLLQQGMVFSGASYPFSPIDRASATASVATGVSPYYHSIVGEKWLNRETLRPVLCTGGDMSPKELSTSTIGDELKVSTQGKAKVVSISPFDDAAILSAGHAADGVYWIDNKEGIWRTSTYYQPQIPGWLLTFNTLHSPATEPTATTWEPVIELSVVNACVTELAQLCVVQETMGFDRVTDLLAVNYYAGTFNQLPVSECQIELQDTYVRLDREIARLISNIEKKIGAEHVLFVLTSTGYSNTESADYEKYKIPTGTFNINRTANLLNMYFGAIWGQGRYVETCFEGQMYLNHKLLESKRISLTDACQRAQEFLAQLSGVRNVYSGLQLLTNINEQTLKIRNGYNPSRCGDILIEVSPGWKLYNEDNQETRLSRASFIQFPIIFYGAGVKAELINDHVTIDRIAPTIAKSIRIRAPNACSAEPLF